MAYRHPSCASTPPSLRLGSAYAPSLPFVTLESGGFVEEGFHRVTCHGGRGEGRLLTTRWASRYKPWRAG